MSRFLKRHCTKFSNQLATVFALKLINRYSIFSLFCAVAGSKLAFASVAQVHGRGAILGDYISNHPAQTNSVQGWRVPLSLVLEAKASPNFSIFLGLDYGQSNFPNEARYLGNRVSDPENKKADLPSSNNNGFGQFKDKIEVGFAYLQYASEFGLLRAGRIPRHWGLGIWKNAQAEPTGGAISTTDSVAFSLDFTPTFVGTVSWDKAYEGNPSNQTDDADGFTIELLLADDSSDPSSSSISRRLGLAYQSFDQKSTKTKLRILDLFTSLRSGPFGIDAELYYPNEGSTKSLDFAGRGGPTSGCPIPGGTEKDPISCDAYKIEGLAALAKFHYLFGSDSAVDGSTWLNAIERGKLFQPTSQRKESHTISAWFGYAKGDRESFSGVPDATNNKIGLVSMHPNIKPALLMNAESVTQIAGMPGGTLQNTVFSRLDYSYESPSFGIITPAIIWARLDVLNARGRQDLRSSVPIDTSKEKVFGTRSKNLGIEFDIGYKYHTQDRITLGLDGAAWVPGKAWRAEGAGKPSLSFGLRGQVSTEF